MNQPLFVVCYHRVFPDRGAPEHHPYFLRGTAVEVRTFRQHMMDLRARFDVIDEGRALAVLEGDVDLTRPACWITFDDAYADVLEHAVPIMDDFEIPGSMFVSTAVLDGFSLPVDRWYATLISARRRSAPLCIAGSIDLDLETPASWARLVDGPEKRKYLRAPPDIQASMLGVLADAFDSATTGPPAGMYLSRQDVRHLGRLGWSIGSHGVSHRLLTELPIGDCCEELDASRRELEQLLGEAPAVCAYPDGAWNDRVREDVRRAGYRAGLALEARPVVPGCDTWAVPRFLAQNDPGWAGRVGIDERACRTG